ncbi:Zn-ribbon domain-containing OB-fold protein [Brevibacillus sp. B_LB10_24]|uniref:Zn-ribbon domain-containing OB-fold protein n=1 Tax=Brevibacillus sp. B_LB10_24 TaxID=3380645 RepID=UPI0038BA3C01
MNISVLSCEKCSAAFIPPKYICPVCRHDRLTLKPASGSGTVYSYTTIHIAPEKFADQAPYHIVLVDLDQGLRVTGRLTGGTPRIGQRVECSRVDESVYWFDPAGQ